MTCQGFPRGSSGFGASQAPPVLDDGRVFFDTRTQLDPRDVDAATDVYQFTPGATFATATTTLLSGAGALPSRFGGVSRDGQDAYVVTRNQLVPTDEDDRGDLFSARAGGGIATQQVRPVAPSPCEGEACKPARSPVAAASIPSASSDGDVPVAPPAPPTFSVSTPTGSALRTAARRGRLDVRVRVGAAGTVTGRLQSKVGGRTRTVGSRTTKVTNAGTTTLRLRLSGAARSQLRRTGALSVGLTVEYSERTNRVRKTIRLTVRRGGSTQKGGRR